MLFVEFAPFIAFRAAHWTDDELRVLQKKELVQTTRSPLSLTGHPAYATRRIPQTPSGPQNRFIAV